MIFTCYLLPVFFVLICRQIRFLLKYMRSRMFIVFALYLCVCTVQTFGQKQAVKPNPEITKMMREVSAKNIEATIRKLVSFGTRNTLSEQDNPTRGIGAARDWLYGEFQKISADCGGGLKLQNKTFIRPTRKPRSPPPPPQKQPPPPHTTTAPPTPHSS